MHQRSSLLFLAVTTLACTPPPPADSQQSLTVPSEEAPSVFNYERVPESEQDPSGVPVQDGIIWYGTWETAMAERARTGKPVMLHMGSPRDRETRVPGYW